MSHSKEVHKRKEAERYKEKMESEKAQARRQMEKNKTKTKNSRADVRGAQEEIMDKIEGYNKIDNKQEQ